MGRHPKPLRTSASTRHNWRLIAVPVAIATLLAATVTAATATTAATPALVVDYEMVQTLTEQQGPNAGRSQSARSLGDVAVEADDRVEIADEPICIHRGPSLTSEITVTMIDDNTLTVDAVLQLRLDCEPDAHADDAELANNTTTRRFSETVEVVEGEPTDLSFDITDGIDQGVVVLTVSPSR